MTLRPTRIRDYKMKQLLIYFSLCVFIAMPLGVCAQKAVIHKTWIEHNVTQNGEKGMKIHVNFNITGMKGKQGEVLVYFECPKGTGLKDTNDRYRTMNGYVCASGTFKPDYDNSVYSDFYVFMPIDEIHMKSGEHRYYCKVRIFDKTTRKFLNDHTYVTFTGTSQGGNASNQNANNQGGRGNVTKRWRENTTYGMFYDCEEYSNGVVSKTLYKQCFACKGTAHCGACYGSGRCATCHGAGGIVSAGYGNYYPCTMCGQTGMCNLCKGKGKCVCGNSEFPGYVPGATTLYGSDGRILTHSSFGSGGGSSSDSSSGSSSGSSSSSLRTTCNVCGGTGISPTPNNGGSRTSWVAYYNSQGTKCPHCGGLTSHYHDRCAHCNVPRI